MRLMWLVTYVFAYAGSRGWAYSVCAKSVPEVVFESLVLEDVVGLDSEGWCG